MFFNFYDLTNILLTTEEREALTKKDPFGIKDVVWGDKCVAVLWADGSKTYVSRVLNGDDREKLLALAYMKKAMGNTTRYNAHMQYWLHCDKTKLDRKEAKKSESKNSDSNTTILYDELENYFTKKEKSCKNCWFSEHGKCTLKDGSCKNKNMWARDDQDMLDFFSKI